MLSAISAPGVMSPPTRCDRISFCATFSTIQPQLQSQAAGSAAPSAQAADPDPAAPLAEDDLALASLGPGPHDRLRLITLRPPARVLVHDVTSARRVAAVHLRRWRG